MFDAYEERFTKRLKISEGQPSPSSFGSIYGSVALKTVKNVTVAKFELVFTRYRQNLKTAGNLTAKPIASSSEI